MTLDCCPRSRKHLAQTRRHVLAFTNTNSAASAPVLSLSDPAHRAASIRGTATFTLLSRTQAILASATSSNEASVLDSHRAFKKARRPNFYNQIVALIDCRIAQLSRMRNSPSAAPGLHPAATLSRMRGAVCCNFKRSVPAVTFKTQ